VLVYDPGGSRLSAELKDSSQFELRKASSTQELEEWLVNSIDAQLGLVVPADFDQVLQNGGQPELQGYVTWTYRHQANGLKSDLQGQLAQLLGQPVHINTQGNIVYPPRDLGLALGMATMTAVTLVLMMGIQLLPTLFFEEKQTKTLEALLVSPASIGQVVIGKALAGMFYVLVTAGLVFAVNWSGVVHWELALLFALGSGLFAVALGLTLGSFFESHNEMSAWLMLLITILIGSIFVDVLDITVPAPIQALVPWSPSVALVNIQRYAFLRHVAWAEAWASLGRVAGYSLLLYAVVVYKVRRADR
jgi:ABC-2 type transport system permease protein